MPGPRWPDCPECFSEEVEVLHEQNPQAASTHATLECQECGRVFKDVIEEPTPLEVHAVVSTGAESQAVKLEMTAGERVRVGEEVYGHGQRLLITAIEMPEGRRVKAAPVDEIKTLWCKSFDTVTVDVSVNKGHITHADELETVPEEEFFIGDELTIHNQPVVIHAIKTDRGIRHYGSAQAKEIVRMFTHRSDLPPEVWDKGGQASDEGSKRGRGSRR